MSRDKQCIDDVRYERVQQDTVMAWEALCHRCGACCGIEEGDPCEHLVQTGRGVYACAIYEQRFGIHKTINGSMTRCVPIRAILYTAWPGRQQCGYVKEREKGIIK